MVLDTLWKIVGVNLKYTEKQLIYFSVLIHLITLKTCLLSSLQYACNQQLQQHDFIQYITVFSSNFNQSSDSDAELLSCPY